MRRAVRGSDGSGGYDGLARWYRALECLAFGGGLQRARRAHLAALDRCERVLIVGEGDGRFLAALCRRNTVCRVVCVERSRKMIERARERLGSARARVTFVQADIRELDFAPGQFDALATHFVLDLFDEATLALLIPRLAAALGPGGVWLVADFALPAEGLRRLRAQGWLAILYAFFRLRTDLEARRLHDPGALLLAADLHCEAVAIAQAGLLHSRCWRKAPIAARPSAGGTRSLERTMKFTTLNKM